MIWMGMKRTRRGRAGRRRRKGCLPNEERGSVALDRRRKARFVALDVHVRIPNGRFGNITSTEGGWSGKLKRVSAAALGFGSVAERETALESRVISTNAFIGLSLMLIE